MRSLLYRMLPFMEWLPELRQWPILRADLLAGLTVAMLLIPQSMAYAHLAGLPVYVGLYAAFIPTIIAALFGSSRYLSTGPVPVTSLLTAVVLTTLAVSGTSDYLQYLVLLTLLAGMIQVALSLMRFGVVVNFLSYPVLLGFINAVALIIASMQLSGLLGVNAISAPRYYQTLWQVLGDAVTSPQWSSIGMASIAFIIMLGGRHWWPRLPHILIAVTVTTCIAWYFGYEKTATIQPEQIISLPVQQLLHNYQQYPEEQGHLLQELTLANNKIKQLLEAPEVDALEVEEAKNEVNQVKWQLALQAKRQHLESGELTRLRLRRLVSRDHHVVFFVAGEMTPIGRASPQEWRIADFLNSGHQLVLHAGGEIVGSVPQGLPTFKSVVWDWNAITRLFMAAMVIALVGFTEAITIAKRMATKSRQIININQELLSQGLAKCVGSFFQSMPVSGSFTRSTINFNTGAKTAFSSVVAGLIVMIVLLWLTPLFYYLPYATLAAVIFVGVLSLLDFKEMRRVWCVSRHEGVVCLLTFILTLFLAPYLAYAIISGMLLSLGLYLYETMRPRFKELVVRDDGMWMEALPGVDLDLCENVSLVRFGGSLYFANVSYFEEKILQLISQYKKLNYIILDCVGINKLDASGMESLNGLSARLEEAGIHLWFTRVREPVFQIMKRSGFVDKLGEGYFYKNNKGAFDAVNMALGKKHRHVCHLREKSQ